MLMGAAKARGVFSDNREPDMSKSLSVFSRNYFRRPRIRALVPDNKLVLLVAEVSCDSNCGVYVPAGLAEDAGFSVEAIQAAIRDLVAAKHLLHDPDTGEIFFVDFFRDNHFRTVNRYRQARDDYYRIESSILREAVLVAIRASPNCGLPMAFPSTELEQVEHGDSDVKPPLDGLNSQKNKGIAPKVRQEKGKVNTTTTGGDSEMVVVGFATSRQLVLPEVLRPLEPVIVAAIDESGRQEWGQLVADELAVRQARAEAGELAPLQHPFRWVKGLLAEWSRAGQPLSSPGALKLVRARQVAQDVAVVRQAAQPLGADAPLPVTSDVALDRCEGAFQLLKSGRDKFSSIQSVQWGRNVSGKG